MVGEEPILVMPGQEIELIVVDLEKIIPSDSEIFVEHDKAALVHWANEYIYVNGEIFVDDFCKVLGIENCYDEYYWSDNENPNESFFVDIYFDGNGGGSLYIYRKEVE